MVCLPRLLVRARFRASKCPRGTFQQTCTIAVAMARPPVYPWVEPRQPTVNGLDAKGSLVAYGWKERELSYLLVVVAPRVDNS